MSGVQVVRCSKCDWNGTILDIDYENNNEVCPNCGEYGTLMDEVKTVMWVKRETK